MQVDAFTAGSVGDGEVVVPEPVHVDIRAGQECAAEESVLRILRLIMTITFRHHERHLLGDAFVDFRLRTAEHVLVAHVAEDRSNHLHIVAAENRVGAGLQ